jgi:hypothetical protein
VVVDAPFAAVSDVVDVAIGVVDVVVLGPVVVVVVEVGTDWFIVPPKRGAVGKW